MWQRIQTLFMFLGAAAAFAMGYLALNAGNSAPAQLDLLIWPTGLVAGLLLANIFNFRKRKLQIRLNSWALLAPPRSVLVTVTLMPFSRATARHHSTRARTSGCSAERFVIAAGCSTPGP